MHMRQIHCNRLIDAQPIRYLVIYNPYACPADLEEAPMNDVYYHVLLLRRHLIVARQTESSAENISPYINSRAFYIGICAASAVPFDRDKRARPVYRLHMHGLPRLSEIT